MPTEIKIVLLAVAAGMLVTAATASASNYIIERKRDRVCRVFLQKAQAEPDVYRSLYAMNAYTACRMSIRSVFSGE